MFQRVPCTSLVVGKKYKIHGPFNVYKGIYNGMNHDTIYNLMFRVKKGQTQYNILFSKQDLFYEFVSNNPQDKMERRAVNLIVQKLIGDIHFTW